MDRSDFTDRASQMLERLERGLGGLEHELLDVQLSADVLTLSFDDGARFVINAHSAAVQIWMAADRTAWHFDFIHEQDAWIAAKTGDELVSTVERVVSAKLATTVRL